MHYTHAYTCITTLSPLILISHSIPLSFALIILFFIISLYSICILSILMYTVYTHIIIYCSISLSYSIISLCYIYDYIISIIHRILHTPYAIIILLSYTPYIIVFYVLYWEFYLQFYSISFTV